MLDLDALESKDGSFNLYCHFGCLLLMNRVTYIEWRILTHVWKLHQYILPNKREILEELLDAGWAMRKKNPPMLIQYALRVRDIETHYTLTHQLRMTELIRLHLRHERDDSSMEKLPENCGTLTPDAFDF